MITSPTNKLYIGSTINITKRFNFYKNYNCKQQIKLYNSFRKYGVENHIFEIVMETTIEEMYKYETLIGWGFDVLGDNGLNLKLPKLGDIYSSISEDVKSKISKGNSGKIRSREVKIKISNSRKGYKQSETHKEKSAKARMKSVIQFDKDNNFIKEWESAKLASKELNLNRIGIMTCCNGLYKTSGGFIWKYK